MKGREGNDSKRENKVKGKKSGQCWVSDSESASESGGECCTDVGDGG